MSRYIPHLLLKQMTGDLNAMTAPNYSTARGAVLLADIAGFTPLAERLAEQPDGAEKLTGYLNDYFGELIDAITDAGGDIVKFAGDALLANWAQLPGETLEMAIRRAAACGLRVQEAMHGRHVDEGIKLSMRVMIGGGDLHCAVVGGIFGRFELTVWGSPMEQLAQVRPIGTAGDVVLSRQAWREISDTAVGEQCGDVGHRLDVMRTSISAKPLAQIEPALLQDDVIRQYVPSAALSGGVVHLDGRWLCELRRVTVLFAKLPTHEPLTDPQAVTKQTQDVMERLQRAAYRYEGSVNKVNVDEKGVTFLAVWGLPPLAHEDDPARAVNAAQMLQADLAEDGLRACLGVATGNVYSGVLGNGRRAEYTVIGDAVNLAARLMEAADDCILCDGATQQVAQTEIEFKELPALTLKGKAKPVVVFQPTGRAVERVRHQTEIVGRAIEREALATLLQGLLRQRESGVVVLEGGAGLGKTRLVQDTKEHAQQLGAEVLLGNALAIESATPYFAWRRALRQLFRFGDKHLQGEALRDHVLAELLEDEVDRLPLLNAVLGTNFVETPRSMELIGEVRADNLHGLICAVLRRRCAETPQLLAFEDAHWIDAASWTLLKVVQRDVHPLGVILATRPMAERPKELDAIAQLPTTRWLTMTGLDAEQTLELVCQRLSCKRLPDVLGKLIQQKAEGNPFFSEQLAYALRDAGLLQIHDGNCTLNAEAGDLAKLSLPNTLQGIITSRIDRLSSQQQLALKVASVVGYEFPQQMVRDVYPVETERDLVPKILPPLTSLEIITDMRGDADTVYTFKHKITEEAVYNLMLFSQRRELHAATAQWYQRIYAEDLNPWLPLLAHHWLRAENWAKALEFADRAGQNAALQFANAAAIRFYTQALEIDAAQKLGTSDEARSRWERRLAQAYFGMGQLDNCTEHATKALSLLGRPMPDLIRSRPASTSRDLMLPRPRA